MANRTVEATLDPKHDPSQELIDVLNDAGEVVGVATRREIRKHRLPHRCTYVLVFRPDGHLLIHQRTEMKDVFPGFWDVTVGGVLGAGETWEDGTKREILEEIGVAAETEFLFDFRYRGASCDAFAKVYRTVHGGPFRLQPEEVVLAEFVPLDDLARLFQERRFCPDGLEVWRSYCRLFQDPVASD